MHLVWERVTPGGMTQKVLYKNWKVDYISRRSSQLEVTSFPIYLRFPARFSCRFTVNARTDELICFWSGIFDNSAANRIYNYRTDITLYILFVLICCRHASRRLWPCQFTRFVTTVLSAIVPFRTVLPVAKLWRRWVSLLSGLSNYTFIW